MSTSAAQQFLSLLENRRLNDATFRILESVSVREDVSALLEITSNLNTILRSELLSVIRDAAEKSVEQKLLVLEFFVRAFALVGDVENCLALRYEALILRELELGSNPLLQVSCTEWLKFAEDSLDAGFFSIAVKACENALSCLPCNDASDSSTTESIEVFQVIEKIKRLKNFAVSSVASHSVQAQAAEYLKEKIIKRRKINPPFDQDTKYAASTLFRNGIKQRNARKLLKCQSSQKSTSEHCLEYRYMPD